MRILCLHGYGTSAAIMRAQLDPLIREADPSYEFVFLEGEHECPPAHGISSTSGPTLCFNPNMSPHYVEASLELIEAFIETDGPFDGILGFSQGGSLTLSYLLEEAIAMASKPSKPTFKFAILCSTIIAFLPNPNFCDHVVKDLTPNDRSLLQTFPLKISDDQYAALSSPQPERSTFFRTLGRVLETCLDGGFIDPTTDLGVEGVKEKGTPESLALLPRVVHPSLLPSQYRIRIPTVHVTGRRDSPLLISMSQLMESVCEPGLFKSFTHDGGHSPPRSLRDVKKLAAALDWAVKEGELLGSI